jgi:hypothetical protein
LLPLLLRLPLLRLRLRNMNGHVWWWRSSVLLCSGIHVVGRWWLELRWRGGVRVEGGSGSVGVGRRIGVPGRSVRGWGRMGVVWRRSGVRVVGGWRFCNWLRMLVLVIVFLGEGGGGGIRRDNSCFEAGEGYSAFTSAQRAGKNKERKGWRIL